MPPLLEVNDIEVYFKVGTVKSYKTVKAVDGVSFTLEKGEAMGLVGESGCGKTTTAYAITGLLPANGEIVKGEIRFNNQVIGKSFTNLSKRSMKNAVRQHEKFLNTIRWKHISIIFQSAMNAFNPVKTIGDQIVEAMLLHENITKAQAYAKAEELFKMVGIEPERLSGYPHEFSGGMKQRAMIAMALSCNPEMIIADEPTTALDVIMQDRILKQLRDLQKKLNLSLIIITHDISVVAETASKIMVMYAGKAAEYGDIKKVFSRPAHPYTIGLMNAFPSILGEKQRLESIPGSPPDLVNPPTGCPFHPRCKYAKDVCKDVVPPMIQVEDNHYSACLFANDIFASAAKGDKDGNI